MKWFRKSLMWASIGCLGASAAQEVVTLGQPTPLPASGQASEIRVVNAFVPIQPRPTVIRASGLPVDDEPRVPTLPRELPPSNDAVPRITVDREASAVQAVQPPAKGKSTIIDLDKKTLPPVTPPPPPAATAPAKIDRSCAASGDAVIILPDRGTSDGGGIFNWNYGSQRIYGGAEYLLWWTRGMNLPPLVTTAPATDPEATRGALGFGGTQVIYGNNTTSAGPSSGGRFTLGYFLDDCGLCAIEANYFFLGPKTDNALFTNPVLGRPFFDINDGVQSRQLTTSPGSNPGDVFSATGSIKVNTSSFFQGAELNLRTLLWCDCNFNVTGLVGMRYLDLNEHLDITENLLILKPLATNPPNVPLRVGDQITVSDQFHTRNQFFGGQVGLASTWYSGRWFLQAGAKVALGETQQSVDIDGSQRIVSTDGRVQNFRGGLYALPGANIGHFSQSRFGFVPQLDLKLGYQVTNNIRVFVGYDFLYWSSVLRPSDQIDQALDLNKVPNSGAPFPAATQARPIVPFHTSSFWATGVSAGIEFRY